MNRAGKRVMAVVATAGSTATGSIDDLGEIARICEQHGVWMHVDAAHGGSALLSAKHRARLAGIERARSVAWDPHKIMLIPSQAGMLLMRDERDLDAAFSQRAPYLFQRADGERAWDQGTRNFMCTRRADAFKLWVALKRYGTDALGGMYDYFCDLTQLFHDEIAERPEFEALHAPESNILCSGTWVTDDEQVADQPSACGTVQSVGRRVDHRHQPRRTARARVTMNGRITPRCAGDHQRPESRTNGRNLELDLC